MIALDEKLFLWINGFAGRSDFFDWLFKGIANDYFILVSSCLMLLALWFWGKDDAGRRNNQKAVLCAGTGLWVAQATVSICNCFLFRTRPFDVLDVNLLFYQPTDSSFPSNAASVMFALAFSVFLYNKKAGRFLIVIASFFVFSRVYVGIHYPLDVLAGALFGFVAAFITSRLLKSIDVYVNRLLDLAHSWHLA